MGQCPQSVNVLWQSRKFGFNLMLNYKKSQRFKKDAKLLRIHSHVWCSISSWGKFYLPRVSVTDWVCESSVYSWENAERDSFAVLVPCRAVLFPALVFVPCVTVHQQSDQVNQVKVRDQMVESTRKRPGQPHDDVTQVIRMTDPPPETRHNKTLSSCSRDGFQVRHCWVRRILSEGKLLRIGFPENIVSNSIHNDESNDPECREFIGMAD